jgi:hypothetical protein
MAALADQCQPIQRVVRRHREPQVLVRSGRDVGHVLAQVDERHPVELRRVGDDAAVHRQVDVALLAHRHAEMLVRLRRDIEFVERRVARPHPRQLVDAVLVDVDAAIIADDGLLGAGAVGQIDLADRVGQQPAGFQ